MHPTKRTFPTNIMAGDGVVKVQELKSAALNCITTRQLYEDGYILIRKLLPQQVVRDAAQSVRELMENEGFVEGVKDWEIARNDASPGLLSRQEWIQKSRPLMNLLEHANLYKAMDILLRRIYRISHRSSLCGPYQSPTSNMLDTNHYSGDGAGKHDYTTRKQQN